MLWFVSNVGNVSNDGRLPGQVIGAKSDRGRVSTHINLIGRLGWLVGWYEVQKSIHSEEGLLSSCGYLHWEKNVLKWECTVHKH